MMYHFILENALLMQRDHGPNITQVLMDRFYLNEQAQGLDTKERCMYFYMIHLSGGNKGSTVSISSEEFARKAGTSERRIRDKLKALQNANLIQYNRYGGESTKTTLHITLVNPVSPLPSAHVFQADLPTEDITVSRTQRPQDTDKSSGKMISRTERPRFTDISSTKNVDTPFISNNYNNIYIDDTHTQDFLALEDLKAAMLAQPLLLARAINAGSPRPVPVQYHENLLHRFILHLYQQGRTGNTLQDALRHLQNWMKFQGSKIDGKLESISLEDCERSEVF